MRKLLTGVAMVALSMPIAACGDRTADNADVAAEANTEVLVDENAAMDANAVMDANAAMDANADEATNNVTEQGSTDH
jgi:hypothetical protein